jgi:hypothetical protein
MHPPDIARENVPPANDKHTHADQAEDAESGPACKDGESIRTSWTAKRDDSGQNQHRGKKSD